MDIQEAASARHRVAYLEDLIRKYINHVGEAEGSCFLALPWHKDISKRSNISEEEWRDLLSFEELGLP